MDRCTIRLKTGEARCSQLDGKVVVERLAAYEDLGPVEELAALKERTHADVAPVVHGEWNYIIEKGSCMDYQVTAKCSECGWDWFSKEGVGNYSAVFSAFITNGDSRPEEAKRFLLENARANNKLNYCPNCGADMRRESEDSK